ncbi:MAG: hypothetical protein ACHQAQ_07240 [Hyphomicrobiales bacterium]
MNRVISGGSPWAAVCKSADLNGVPLHDLRHWLAGFDAGASLGLPIIGKLLGHSEPSTTIAAHLDADPMRRAVETIGATISAAKEAKANVVSISHAKRQQRSLAVERPVSTVIAAVIIFLRLLTYWP